MKIPSEFDPIRPFEPEELPEVFDRLLADPQFQHVLAYLYPGVPVEAIGQKMKQCKTNLDFQKAFCYPFLQQLVQTVSAGIDVDAYNLDIKKRYTFVSNHRDIVLDSAFLDRILIDVGFETTCEIAIGDNLLIYPWIERFVRMNKAFIVRRSLSPKELLLSSQLMSRYMHHVIATGTDNIWIAQREGRAKDSNDRTQPSVLRMMTLGTDSTPFEALRSMHLVPLTISYEYDPCDYLKAREFQLKRDNSAFKKSQKDDLDNMRVGILGKKGRVHYQLAPCIDEWIEDYKDLPTKELLEAVAQRIDTEIHKGYRIFATNYIAADLLEGNTRFAEHYTAKERAQFEEYLQGRIALIDLPEKDVPFLRERMLTMYANPLYNQLKALQND